MANHQFIKSIGTVNLLLTSINCMIGGGWLMVAFYGATSAGPASIISWTISALLIIVIAFCFSELSTTFPVAGGIARYSHFSHGSSISFGMSWLAWLSCVACAPTEVQVILQHINPYYPESLPALFYVIDNTSHLTYFGIFCAISMLALMSWINAAGVQFMMKLSSPIAIWKLIFPIITIIMILNTRFEFSNFTSHEFMPMGWQGVLEASTFCIFSFLGFREATCLASEVKNPHIAIPIAVIGSVLICFFIYISLQAAYIGSVQTSMLTKGWGLLNYPGDTAPIFSIVKSIGLMWLSATISVDAAISPFGTGLSYTATSARLVYAISKNGFVPNNFARISPKGVPIQALVLNFLVGTVMFFTLSAWEQIVRFQTLAMFVAYGVAPIALYSLRHQLPNLNRPFRIPGDFTGCLIVFYACNLLALWSGWEAFKTLLIWLAIGYVTFISYSYWNKTAHISIFKSRSALWVIPYYAGLGALSCLSTYGSGYGLITIGWDLLVDLAFSYIILKLAFISRLSDKECKNRMEVADSYDFNESV
ncbi:MAG: amino acid permease [Gammaproteobacteria bacterium]|nr:amino acid permease [Gammaproteobacteria bacterium]